MANFCNKCGAPSSGGVFCGKCGADLRTVPVPQPQVVAQPQVQSYASTPPQPQAQTAPAAKMSPLIKIAIVAVVILFVGGVATVGGMYYLVYRVKQKVQEVKTEVLGADPSKASTRSGSRAAGDGCRLLSKEDVGGAIGVEIVATEPNDGGCSYLAKGNSADMTAKHMAAFIGSKGADAQSQKMMQGFAGTIFKASQRERPKDTPDSNGNVPVFSFSIDTNSADTQMQLNEKVLGGLGPPEAPMEGIGDHAFDTGGSMMMVLKGDKLIRIMYMMCPCNTEAIKPLARTLADRL